MASFEESDPHHGSAEETFRAEKASDDGAAYNAQAYRTCVVPLDGRPIPKSAISCRESPEPVNHLPASNSEELDPAEPPSATTRGRTTHLLVSGRVDHATIPGNTLTTADEENQVVSTITVSSQATKEPSADALIHGRTPVRLNVIGPNDCGLGAEYSLVHSTDDSLLETLKRRSPSTLFDLAVYTVPRIDFALIKEKIFRDKDIHEQSVEDMNDLIGSGGMTIGNAQKIVEAGVGLLKLDQRFRVPAFWGHTEIPSCPDSYGKYVIAHEADAFDWWDLRRAEYSYMFATTEDPATRENLGHCCVVFYNKTTKTCLVCDSAFGARACPKTVHDFLKDKLPGRAWQMKYFSLPKQSPGSSDCVVCAVVVVLSVALQLQPPSDLSLAVTPLFRDFFIWLVATYKELKLPTSSWEPTL